MSSKMARGKEPTAQSLLEQALALPRYRNAHNTEITGDDIDLAVAWASGELGMAQIRRVKGDMGTATFYVYIARSLREAFKKGIITCRSPKP